MAKQNKKKDKNKKSLKDLSGDMVVEFVKSYVFPILAVLGLGLMTYLVYMPYVELIPELLSNAAALEENNTKLTQNLAALRDANALPLSSMEATLDEMIPTEPKVASLANVLATQAEASGLEVVTPQQNETSSDSDTEETDEFALEELSASERERYSTDLGVIPIPVELKLTGTRQEMEAFFTALENQDRIVTIEQVQADISGNIWSIDIMVYGYQGAVFNVSLPSYEERSADDEKVFSTIRTIDLDITQERFSSVTSAY